MNFSVLLPVIIAVIAVFIVIIARLKNKTRQVTMNGRHWRDIQHLEHRLFFYCFIALFARHCISLI